MKKLFFFCLLALLAFFATTTAVQAQDNAAKERTGAIKLTTAQVDSMKSAETAKLALFKVATPEADTAATLPFGADYNNPETFFAEGFMGALKAGLLAIFITLGLAVKQLRPLIERSGGKFAASAAVALVALASLVAFRQGAFTENFVEMLLNQYLPNFAYSGLVYNAIKFILGLLPKKIGSK